MKKCNCIYWYFYQRSLLYCNKTYHMDLYVLFEVKEWYENVRPYTKECKNPYFYWKENQGHKWLRKFAKKLFIYTGSSVARQLFFFFFLWANIADDKRTNMTPDNFSALSIVKANIDKVHKILLNKY